MKKTVCILVVAIMSMSMVMAAGGNFSSVRPTKGIKISPKTPKIQDPFLDLLQWCKQKEGRYTFYVTYKGVALDRKHKAKYSSGILALSSSQASVINTKAEFKTLVSTKQWVRKEGNFNRHYPFDPDRPEKTRFWLDCAKRRIKIKFDNHVVYVPLKYIKGAFVGHSNHPGDDYAHYIFRFKKTKQDTVM